MLSLTELQSVHTDWEQVLNSHMDRMVNDTSPNSWRPNLEADMLRSTVDDEIDPTTFTIFSADADGITAAWMSIDIEGVISLREAI